jgi:hypothetical protein
MQGADIGSLGMLFFKDGRRGGRESSQEFAVVLKPLL